MLETAGASGGRHKRVGLVLVPRADLVILEAVRRAAIRGEPDKTLAVDVAIDLRIPSRDVQRGLSAKVEIETEARRDVASGPAIFRTAEAQVPRQAGEVAALRVGCGGHRVTVVESFLIVPLGVDGQRAASAEVDGDRGEHRQATLVVVEAILEPLRRGDDPVTDALPGVSGPDKSAVTRPNPELPPLALTS